MTSRRVRLLAFPLLAVVLACAGCNAAPQTSDPLTSGSVSASITVSVRDLKPTTSMDAQVVASPVIVITAPTGGTLTKTAPGGAVFVKGDTLAVIEGKPVVATVDGTVVDSFVMAGKAVPANLPILTISYAGFALQGSPAVWGQNILWGDDVAARGQITDGPAPFTCLALDQVATADAAGSGGGPAPWACLIPDDTTAYAGQAGIVVATATVASQVIAVPVNAVAGRQGSGQVTLISSDGPKVVNVTLGRTDGSYVEILDGLKVGDEISPLAPNLSMKAPS